MHNLIYVIGSIQLSAIFASKGAWCQPLKWLEQYMA